MMVSEDKSQPKDRGELPYHVLQNQLGLMVASWVEGSPVSFAGLTEKLHLSRYTVRRIETGKRKAEFIEIILMMEALGLPVESITVADILRQLRGN